MFNLIKTLIYICLLREGPEELPHSYVVLSLIIAISLVISVLIGSIANNIKTAGLSSIAVLFFSFAFTKILLLKKPERFLQTFSAMLGTDTIISTVSLPSIYSLTFLKLGETANAFFSLTIFALIVWVVIVFGYIFSKALSSLMSFGIAISVGYVLLNFMILDFFIAGNTPT